jgi:NitT/TauT family transport system permease protein
MQAVMRASFRYLPLVLLALGWEAVARANLVDSSALPPVSKVAVAWVDLVGGGELIDNGKASLYRGSVGLLLAIVGGGGLGLCMARWRLPRCVPQSAC